MRHSLYLVILQQNSIYVFQEKEFRGLNSNFHIDVSTYFPAAE